MDEKYGNECKDDKVVAKNSFGLSGPTQMMQEISTNGLVTAAFKVYEDFTRYAVLNVSDRLWVGIRSDVKEYVLENIQGWERDQPPFGTRG